MDKTVWDHLQFKECIRVLKLCTFTFVWFRCENWRYIKQVNLLTTNTVG